MKTVNKEATFCHDRMLESVTFVDGTTVYSKEIHYDDRYSMKHMVYIYGYWSNSISVVRNESLPRKEVACYVHAYYQKMAEHEIFETTDKLYYGGLLVVFEKEYCRLASSDTFKGEFFKNQKGLVIFKASEKGTKTLEIRHSKRRGRFYDDETIVKMEAESGYTSGFYKDWHWKIK